jgi:mono/diheme cytochrome c family protein
LALALAGCAGRVQRARNLDPPPGAAKFASYCSACHQYDGQGMGDAPSLDASSPWVSGPPERLIKIVLHGVKGKMEIAGRTYDREMPGFGKMLTDEQTASLLSFVRRRFAGINKPVTPAEVTHVRASNQDRTAYWSVEELLANP